MICHLAVQKQYPTFKDDGRTIVLNMGLQGHGFVFFYKKIIIDLLGYQLWHARHLEASIF